MVFDDMIAEMIRNQKLRPVVAKIYIRGRKLNISLVFITQSYFKVPKQVGTKLYSQLHYETSK